MFGATIRKCRSPAACSVQRSLQSRKVEEKAPETTLVLLHGRPESECDAPEHFHASSTSMQRPVSLNIDYGRPENLRVCIACSQASPSLRRSLRVTRWSPPLRRAVVCAKSDRTARPSITMKSVVCATCLRQSGSYTESRS